MIACDVSWFDVGRSLTYFREAFLLVLSGKIIASYLRASKPINVNCPLAVLKE
jgi:hypothetical protein